MIGTALFVAVFSVEGWLRPGYVVRSSFVSALALGPRGWIQISNFLVLGSLFLLFARGVAAEFREGKASKAGWTLFTIIGLAFAASGPLVMDPFNTAREEMSWHGILHGLFGALVFSLGPASCFVLYRRFREDPAWRSLAPWTLLAGIVSTAAVLLLRVGPSRSPAPLNVFNDWAGAIQRVALISFLAWIFTFARALRRRV